MPSDVRYTGIVGIVEEQGLTDVSVHFSEWWNGEGLDFEFGDDGKRIQLHIDEINALVTACMVAGFVDIEACEQNADVIRAKAKEREALIRSFRKDYDSVD